MDTKKLEQLVIEIAKEIKKINKLGYDVKVTLPNTYSDTIAVTISQDLKLHLK